MNRIFLSLAFLTLLACGGSGRSPWNTHDVAPEASVVAPFDDLFALDTDSDRFGVGYLGSDELVAIGYAANTGDAWTWFTGAHAEANEPFVAEPDECPDAGTYFVYAVGLFGTEYIARFDYAPGTLDGVLLSRNNQWVDAP